MMGTLMTRSTRTIWIMALTAVLSLGAGLGLSRMIISPADAAANTAPPPAGPITVPVEERTLANDIHLRGDAIYEDPASVTLETGDIGGPAIVTGNVPEVGATLEAGQVMLEVTGRPVILLTGDLPVYRTLRAGVSGPDVLQLKAALAALGINPGDTTSDAYDSATAAAVGELYARVGYPAPSAGEDAQAALDGARDMVRSGEEQLAAAQRELTAAGVGTPQSERIRLQADVNTAQAELDAARAVCAAPTEEIPCDAIGLIRAEGTLAVAVAARNEGNAAPDTSSQRAAVTAAQRALAEAKDDLAVAQREVITPLPASEVVYLSSTPRRVDSVEVTRGSVVAGTSVMSVSGATLQIAAAVSPTDAELITEGAVVDIALPGGEHVPGAVLSIGVPVTDSGDGQDGSGDSDAGRIPLVVTPGELTEDQRSQLQGANVLITIPVGSTGGDVLAVPTAALTAGPGGEARVEVLQDDDTTTLVTVTTGLAAGGFVQVTPVDGTLVVGDRVVIGVSAGSVEEETGTGEKDTEGDSGSSNG
jgi:hypothetical protein